MAPLRFVAEAPSSGLPLSECVAATAIPAAAFLKRLRRESVERIMISVLLLYLESCPIKSGVPLGQTLEI
jgi:hypothetical protein